jgi:hypothetical protein
MEARDKVQRTWARYAGFTRLVVEIKHQLFLSDLWIGVDLRMDTRNVHG